MAKTKTWICRAATYVAGHGVVRPGQRIEIEDGAEVSERIRNSFAPERPKEAAEKEARDAAEKDMTFRAKVERLKDMKVKIPAKAGRAKIDALYAEFCEKVELPALT